LREEADGLLREKLTTTMARLHHNHHKPHVVVVGADILGASITFHLTLHGVPVTIVDAGEPGQGTSRVSFAWLNASGKPPLHYHDFNRRSLDMWERFARRLGGSIDLVWGGELRWSVTAAGAADLAARARSPGRRTDYGILADGVKPVCSHHPQRRDAGTHHG
jgi:glycine/D-amino acid oxidase-like deaminating enzyme